MADAEQEQQQQSHGVRAAALQLSNEVRELSLGTSGDIPRLPSPPSPLVFLRDFVSPNRPCIISNALHHWPALRSWSNAYLLSALQHQLVSVHFTPDGFADALVDLQRISSIHGCRFAHVSASSSSPEKAVPPEDEVWFATAHVERLPFPTALDLILRSGLENGVAYAQHQNGSFLSEYGVLADDAETHIPWATEALGCMPEAVNLWIGNEKAVTSFHKDHYENLYVVVAGEKHFTLLPPTDVHRLYVRQYPSAHYTRYDGKYTIERDRPPTSTPWVSIGPYPPPERLSDERSQFPLYFGEPKPFTCTVQAGEILYS